VRVAQTVRDDAARALAAAEAARETALGAAHAARAGAARAALQDDSDDESDVDEGGRSSYAALEYDDEAEAGSWDASTPAAGAPAAATAVASGERLVKPARAQPPRAGEEPPRWSYTDSTEVGELKARRRLAFALVCLCLLWTRLCVRH
jgi:hypothetical protein